MRLKLAIQAFLKAFRDPKKAQKFIEDSSSPLHTDLSDQSHLRLLQYLQHSSRLVDFIKEDIGSFNDAQVGAAVRKIHQDCSKALEDLVTLRPLKDEQEGSSVQIPKGYNPAEIKVVGKIKGEPPFTGILVHRGWKALKRSLPKKGSEQSLDVICPAEVEVKS